MNIRTSLILSIILLVFSSAYSQSTKKCFEFNFTDKQNLISSSDGVSKFYFYKNVEPGELFNIKFNSIPDKHKNSNHESVEIDFKAPFKIKLTLDSLQNIDFVLEKNQEMVIEIKISENDKIERYWKLEFTTSEHPVNNANFLFISAIKSVGNAKQESELFDVFFKFNWGRSERYMSLAGMDVALVTDDDEADLTPNAQVNEALITLNKIILGNFNKHKPVAKVTFDELNRAAFVGIGSKIFDQRLYVGGHLGAIEIDGPLFTSYVFGGYYRDLYTSSINFSDSINTYNNYKHNIYTEVAFSAYNSDVSVELLKNLRIKVGMMFPMKSENDEIRVRPQDIRTRVVLEIPLGKILTYKKPNSHLKS